MSNLAEAIIYEVMRGNISAMADLEPHHMPTDESANIWKGIIVARNNGGITWDNVRMHIRQDAKIVFKQKTMDSLKNIENSVYGYHDEMAQNLKNEWMAIQFRMIGQKMARAGGEDCSLQEVWDLLEQGRQVHSGGMSQKDLVHGKDAVEELLARTDESIAKERVFLSQPILKDIWSDYLMPRLYVIGGRPSMGKNILVDNLVVDFITTDYKGLYITFDNTINETASTILANLTGIYYKNIESNSLMREERERIDNVKDVLSNVWFIQKNYTISQIRSGLEKAVSQNDIRWMVLDYFTKIRLGRTGELATQYQHAVDELASMARELKIPVIVISQVNKDGDLKWTGALYEAAYHVITVDGNKESNSREVVIEKFKKGKAGVKIYISFDGQTGRLERA